MKFRGDYIMNNNSEKRYTLNVYNTCTGRHEDVEVTEEVYNAFRRSYWNEKKNNKRYRDKTYPFSALCGSDSCEEKFSEFASDNCLVERETELRDEAERCFSMVTETMRRRLLLYYCHGYSIKEIAEMEQVSFDAVRQSIETGKEKIKTSRNKTPKNENTDSNYNWKGNQLFFKEI